MVQASTPQEQPQPAVTFGSTVTILFSDIRGFTEFTDAYGDEVAYRMLQYHNTLVEEQILFYGGHIVKTLGDSFMVSFEAARTAITCAVAMQRAVDRHNRAQQGPKMEIGIGINTGEPVREAGDFFGGTVNLASRICAVAGPDQILVSETVRHVVGRMQGAEFLDRGFFELKGFQEPQHLFEVDWAGAGAAQAAPVAAPPETARPAAVAAPPTTAPMVPPVAVIHKPPPLVPILAGGLVVLLLLGVGGVLLLRPGAGEREVGPAVPPKEEALAAAPGQKLLFQDDFSDPAKGFFPPKAQETRPDGLAIRQGYENGEYVMRLEGLSRSYGHAAVAGSVKPTEDFGVEVTARSLNPKQPVIYHLVWTYGQGDSYQFGVYPAEKTFVLCKSPCNRPSTQGAARFLQEETATKLRMELSGSQVRLLANDQLLDELIVEDLARRGGALGLGVSAPRGGEIAMAFEDFKVYALGEPAAAAPTAETEEPAKGALLFQAKLDGTKSDVHPYTLPNPQAADIRFVPGAIEVVVLVGPGPQAKAGAVFNTAMQQTYVGEYDLSFKPGSDMGLWWEIRTDTAKQGQYIVTLHAPSESMKLVYFDMKTGKEEPLTSAIPVPGLRTGRVVTLTAAVGRSRYMLFVDGQQVADVTDTRLTAPWTLSFTGHGSSGHLRIHGARVYALEETPAASVAEPTPFPTPLPTPVPSKPTPTAATKVLAPGDILYEDDPNDPAKRLFRKAEGTTPAGIAYKWGYEDGEYVVRVPKGSKNNGTYGTDLNFSFDYHYAVEAQVRAEGLLNKIRYGVVLRYADPEHYGLQVTPSNGAWNVFYNDPSRKSINLAGKHEMTPLANKGSAANLLRLEVRGSELKVFINRQLLGTVNHEGLKKRPVRLVVGVWTANEDLKEGEGEAIAAFSRFKVYYLGGP